MISEEKGVRQLHFGSQWVQGAMRISRPYALELEYTREMMAPLLLNPGPAWPRTALFVGLGVGALPKFLHRHRPDCHITTVEISHAVVAAASLHFKLPRSSPKFQVEVGCGADFMASSTRQFDLIMVDGFDAKARVGPLNSTAFYLDCKSRLNEGGYVVVNLLSNQKDSAQGRQRFVDAFDGKAVVLSPCSSGNVVALAGEVAFELHGEELQENCSRLKEDTGLNLASTVAKLLESASKQAAPPIE
ncbi:MAG TPA: spermidine synthase [Limnobacter sp.]|nr:spermidine synthase [Limnobacter sp.]